MPSHPKQCSQKIWTQIYTTKTITIKICVEPGVRGQKWFRSHALTAFFLFHLFFLPPCIFTDKLLTYCIKGRHAMHISNIHIQQCHDAADSTAREHWYWVRGMHIYLHVYTTSVRPIWHGCDCNDHGYYQATNLTKIPSLHYLMNAGNGGKQKKGNHPIRTSFPKISKWFIFSQLVCDLFIYLF